MPGSPPPVPSARPSPRGRGPAHQVSGRRRGPARGWGRGAAAGAGRGAPDQNPVMSRKKLNPPLPFPPLPLPTAQASAIQQSETSDFRPVRGAGGEKRRALTRLLPLFYLFPPFFPPCPPNPPRHQPLWQMGAARSGCVGLELPLAQAAGATQHCTGRAGVRRKTRADSGRKATSGPAAGSPVCSPKIREEKAKKKNCV